MTDAEPRIVLKGMTIAERRDVVAVLAGNGINEEIVVDGESERTVGELRAAIEEAVDEAREAGVPNDVIAEVL